MKKELKIYIDDYKSVEEKLRTLGAIFDREIDVYDTYFRQPEGFVLKLTTDDSGSYLVKLQADSGGFRIISQETLVDPKITQDALEEKYGIKCVLNKRKRFWEFEEYNISINLFDDLGQFLIVEGEEVAPEFITEKLGIKNPKYLTISFDQLKEQLS